MFFQALNSIDPKLQYLLRTNPNRSLSGIYKAIRKNSKVASIGDYPLLSYILHFYFQNGITWNRGQIIRAIKYADFWREEGHKQVQFPKEFNKYLTSNGEPR